MSSPTTAKSGIPISVAFRGVPHSPALEALIRERAERLFRFYDRILEVDVVVEGPPKHHHLGGHYRVRIDIEVPGEDIHVGREPAPRTKHGDPNVVVAHAFDAARRRLQDFVRRRREPPHGDRVLARQIAEAERS